MFFRKRKHTSYKKTYEQSREAEYIQLKTELDNYIKIRNTLNTFMITTFVAIIALVYNNEPEPMLFIFAQFLIIPVLIRLVDYKRTEARLAAYIIDNFKEKFPCGVGWESERYKHRWYFFEFFVLSVFITLHFFIFACEPIIYPIVSAVISLLILGLTIIGNVNTLKRIENRKRNKQLDKPPS